MSIKSQESTSNMGLQSLPRRPSGSQTRLIVLAVIAGFVIGVPGLIDTSPYSLLIGGGTIATILAVIAWFRKPVWALYAALFVVLLPIGLIPPHIHSILNRSLAVIALVTWLFAAVTRGDRVAWTTTTLLMVGFLIWGTVTLLWAENLDGGITILQAYTLRLVLFLVLVASEIRTKENLQGLMTTLAVNWWILMIAGAGTVLLSGYVPGTRLQVFDANQNYFGVLALVTLPGVLWRATQTSNGQVLRTLTVPFFLSMVIFLVAMSGSRGSAISLLVILCAFCLWRPTRRWGILGLLILLIAVVVLPYVFSTTLERFAIRPGDTFLGGREFLWRAGWRIISEHPFRGVGIGNAGFALLSSLGFWLDQDGLGGSLHNPVLTIWCETGVLGIILYLGVLISAVWSFVRHYRHHRELEMLWLMPYFALVGSVFLGYMASWIKGGGIESDFTIFLMLSLLLIPSGLNIKEFGEGQGIDAQGAGGGQSKCGRAGMREIN